MKKSTYFITLFGFLYCSCTVKLFQPNIAETGRATSIGVDPKNKNIIFVTSETGGLFKSVNGGEKWEHLDDFPTYNLNDVSISPFNSKIIIVTANSDFSVNNGGGIWRSIDGGNTWIQPPSSLPSPNGSCRNSFLNAYGISFSKTNQNIYVGTDCGLAISKNNGETWTFISVDGRAVKSVHEIEDDKILVITNGGVYKTQDGGISWKNISEITIHCSDNIHGITNNPFNIKHLFVTTSPKYVYQSVDGGENWSKIYVNEEEKDCNRPQFVMCAYGFSNYNIGSNKFELYFGDGVNLRNLTLPIGGTATGIWLPVRTDHADPSHIGINPTTGVPILLATDGGLHRPYNDFSYGAWYLIGNKSGYSALQITEIKGQKIMFKKKHNLYFGTQDNYVWASTNAGETWERNFGGEGGLLEMEREVERTEDAKINFVAIGLYRTCDPVPNVQLNADFSTFECWKNPESYDRGVHGNPAILKKDNYVQLAKEDMRSHTLYFTPNNGRNWIKRIKLDNEPLSQPLIVGDIDNPVIYIAVKIGYSGVTGMERIGLLRIDNIYRSPVRGSLVSGDLAIGTFPTMFIWYKVFGVNPTNPDHIIVTDIEGDRIMVTTNGGLTWNEDTNLKNLVTRGGEMLNKNRDNRPQINTIQFDPCNTNHILIGTSQAGVFKSNNGGRSWEAINYTEKIPLISSFFFDFENCVVFSSYGRGLWELNLKRRPCPNPFQNSNIPNHQGIITIDTIYQVNDTIPYITSNLPNIKIISPKGGTEKIFYNGDNIRIFGNNLKSVNGTLKLLINDTIVSENLKIDGKGEFIFDYNINHNIGNYKFILMSNNDIIDVASFRVVVKDNAKKNE